MRQLKYFEVQMLEEKATDGGKGNLMNDQEF
jgi:hypothetical protein